MIGNWVQRSTRQPLSVTGNWVQYISRKEMLRSIGAELSVVKKNCLNRKLSTTYHRELSTEHHLARTICNRESSTVLYNNRQGLYATESRTQCNSKPTLFILRTWVQYNRITWVQYDRMAPAAYIKDWVHYAAGQKLLVMWNWVQNCTGQ